MDRKSAFKYRLLLSVATLALSAPVQAADQRRYVSAIHSQYLSTDFKSEDGVQKLLLAVKQGLEKAQSAEPEDFVAEENLLGLYEQVIVQAQEERSPKHLLKEAAGKRNFDTIFNKLKDYEAKHGKVVPTGWSLPEEFKVIVPGVDRKYDTYKGRTSYSLGLFGWLHDGQEMPEQVQVIRFPDAVILDKQKSVGGWSDGRTWQGPMQAFSFGTENDATPPKDGFYLLNIKMKGKALVSGWFVVNNMTLDEAPMVSSPFMGQVFKSSSPTMKWLDFTSKQLRDFETRKRILYVTQDKEDSHPRIWHRAELYPDDRESISIESLTDDQTYHGKDVRLTKGNYEFEATFQERWFVGDLLMQRSTTTKVPFSVSP